MRGLNGKAAIVTGAAGGLGAATVRRLVEEGCRVAAVDIEQVALEKLAASCGAGQVLAVPADVRREGECDRYVAEAVRQLGGVHFYVNNAGVIGKHYPIAEMPTEEFDRVHAVNLRGVFFGLRAVLRQMIRQGQGGSIVNIASVGALRANRYSSPYGSAKRAVIGLSGAAALENGQYGIRVNTVCRARWTRRCCGRRWATSTATSIRCSGIRRLRGSAILRKSHRSSRSCSATRRATQPAGCIRWTAG